MIAHGIDGWVLATYEWDEKTGNGIFTYERTTTSGNEHNIETARVVKAQPLIPTSRAGAPVSYRH